MGELRDRLQAGKMADETLCFSSDPGFGFEGWTAWGECKERFSVPSAEAEAEAEAEPEIEAPARCLPARTLQLARLLGRSSAGRALSGRLHCDTQPGCAQTCSVLWDSCAAPRTAAQPVDCAI